MSDKINFRVNALVYDRSSKLYIGTQQGLFVYDTLADKLEQTLIRRDVLLSDNEVTALAFSGGDGLWLATHNNLHHLSLADNGIISRPVDADGVIRSIIDHLPEKQRSVMQLRDFENKSYKEIATILDISEEQVKVNIFRARQAIKQKYIETENYGL